MTPVDAISDAVMIGVTCPTCESVNDDPEMVWCNGCDQTNPARES